MLISHGPIRTIDPCFLCNSSILKACCPLSMMS
jgi:hypothetical protein